MAIVKLRLESRYRSSASVEFGNSLPRRWTRDKHASEIRLAGLESCTVSELVTKSLIRQDPVARERPRK